MSDFESLDVAVQESAIDYEDNQTVTGSIEGLSTRTWESPEGDDVLYVDLSVRDSQTDIEFTPSFAAGSPDNPSISKSTQLGALLNQFVDIEAHDSLDVADILGDQAVEFEIEQTDDGYFNAKKQTLRPEGGETQTDGAGETQDSGVRDEVLTVVSDFGSRGEGDVKQKLINDHNAAAVGELNTLMEEGVVVEQDGELFVSE